MNYQLSLYEKAVPSELTWDERFACAKKNGFDAMELSIDETDDRLSRLEWTKSERDSLREAADNAGISLSSICLSAHRKYSIGSVDDFTRERGMEIMVQALQFACDLGIPVIQLAGYDVYYERSTDETVENFENNLKKCTELAAQYGILLGFETMETPFMDTVGKAMRYVKVVNSPYLNVYPDIGNLKNASLIYGVSVDDDLQLGNGHLIATHVKETLPGRYREVPFGTGHTEFHNNLKTVWSLGVRRFVAEMWYVGQEDWEKDVAFAAKFVRGFLDKVSEMK